MRLGLLINRGVVGLVGISAVVKSPDFFLSKLCYILAADLQKTLI